MLKQTVGSYIRFMNGEDIVEGDSVVVREDPLITVDFPNEAGYVFVYNWDIHEGWNVDSNTLLKVLTGEFK